jgi:hypothetical protein
VELVHVILEAITKHTKGIIDPTINYLAFLKNEDKKKQFA